MLVAAGGEAQEMAAERGGPAGDEVAGEAVVEGAEGMLPPVGLEVPTEDVGHLEPSFSIDRPSARCNSGESGHALFSRPSVPGRSR